MFVCIYFCMCVRVCVCGNVCFFSCQQCVVFSSPFQYHASAAPYPQFFLCFPSVFVFTLCSFSSVRLALHFFFFRYSSFRWPSAVFLFGGFGNVSLPDCNLLFLELQNALYFAFIYLFFFMYVFRGVIGFLLIIFFFNGLVLTFFVYAF